MNIHGFSLTTGCGLIAACLVLASVPALAGDEALKGRVEEIERFFNGFSRDNIELADAFYDPNVVFQDPVVEIRGRNELKSYYAAMYEKVQDIRFEFSSGVGSRDAVAVFWKMELRARGLKGGEPVILEGASHILFGGDEGKAIYHRDYFDMGAFVYENIPALGTVVRYVKNRVGKHD